MVVQGQASLILSLAQVGLATDRTITSEQLGNNRIARHQAAVWLTDGSRPRVDAGGVDSKPSPVPERKAIADDLYPACVGHGGGEVHVGKAHIANTLFATREGAAARAPEVAQAARSPSGPSRPRQAEPGRERTQRRGW